MRVPAVLLLLCSVLSADVVVLKDGSKVPGRVIEKGDHVEVTTEAGLRTYLKDEVERILKDPKELLGDADAVYESAKKDFEAALALPPSDQQARIKEAIAKVGKAREAYAGAIDLFPEDDALGRKLMLVMQLMRLCRDRLGSEFARRPGPVGGVRPSVVNTMPLEEAFSVLFDPAKRADAARRGAARDAFRVHRANSPEIYEIATAAMLFLGRSDEEWQLRGSALKALQEYFARAWLKEPLKMTPAAHQEAAGYLVDRIASLRKADAAAAVEPIALFGVGHVGHAPSGAEADRVARLLGLQVLNGIAGTPEGHVVRDLNGWIAGGDFDLAVLAWVKEYRAVDTAVTRFVWSYALLRTVQAKKRGFERPAAAFNTVQATSAALREHVAAMVKSIKAAGVCSTCAGEGKLRCTNCFGKKEIRYNCAKCKGAGKVMPPGAGLGGPGGRGGLIEPIQCYPCRGRGFDRLLKCEKCKDGYNECRQCDRKQHSPPEMEDICELKGCEGCDGRGYVFRRILWACKSCMGVGQRLVPKADPTKLLP